MIEFINQGLPSALFLLFCLLSVISGVGVITLRNPVSSAFSLIVVLLNVAGIFAMQEAYFVSAVQVLVYAGAIMVLFVFVIMLLSIEQVEQDWPAHRAYWPVPIVLGLAFFAFMFMVFSKGAATNTRGNFTPEAIAQHGGNVRVVSEVMFSDYALPFLVVGMLLSAAIVGCVVLAKRRVD